jgi:hypothetical protein
VRRARLDIHLVLANGRVLFGLETTRLSHSSNGAAESMLGIARLGAAADHQGGTVDRPGAADAHQGVVADYKGVVDCRGITADRQGAVVGRQGTTADCQGAITGRRMPSPTVRVSSPAVEANDLGVWIFKPTLRWAPTVVVSN